METGSPKNIQNSSPLKKRGQSQEVNRDKSPHKNNYNTNNDERNKDSSLQSTSLVKYDTQFLVSTTLSNKKALEELDENNENAEIFLRNLINKRGSDEKGGDMEDYSVRDALNKILPPKKIYKNDQLWVQYVSCTPVTKAEVHNLQEGLDRRLQTLQARETGICPIREQLYNECFDELIRQVTINCLERGILLMRVKREIEMTINSYQTLYESSIAYGIRTSLIVIYHSPYLFYIRRLKK
jgi:dynein light intermediate chain